MAVASPGVAVALASARTAKVSGSGTSRCAEAAIDKARALSSRPAAATEEQGLEGVKGSRGGGCKQRLSIMCGASLSSKKKKGATSAAAWLVLLHQVRMQHCRL